MYKPNYEQELAISKSNMQVIDEITNYLSKKLSSIDPELKLEILTFLARKRAGYDDKYNYAFDKMLYC